jgi:hypothetical protein
MIMFVNVFLSPNLVQNGEMSVISKLTLIYYQIIRASFVRRIWGTSAGYMAFRLGV